MTDSRYRLARLQELLRKFHSPFILSELIGIQYPSRKDQRIVVLYLRLVQLHIHGQLYRPVIMIPCLYFPLLRRDDLYLGAGLLQSFFGTRKFNFLKAILRKNGDLFTCKLCHN